MVHVACRHANNMMIDESIMCRIPQVNYGVSTSLAYALTFDLMDMIIVVEYSVLDNLW